MKKNTKTYLLIAAVLGIWGTIGYQVVSGLNPHEPETAQSDIDVSFMPKNNREVVVFSVNEVDRDPFLGTLTKQKVVKHSYSNKDSSSKMSWPSVTYQGLVKNQNSAQQIFVVTINNQQHLLKKRQIADSITLLRGSIKNIVVSYKNKQKTIPIQ